MGDKETFANELDRLLYPMIEWLDANGILTDDPDDPSTEERGRLVGTFGNLQVSIDWGEVDRPGLVYITRTDVSVGNVLYERFQGRTLVFHPGEWVMRLWDWINGLQVAADRKEIEEALLGAISRSKNFTPV